MIGKIKIYKYFITNIFIFLLFISFSKINFAEEPLSFEFQEDKKIGGFAKSSGGSKKEAKNFLTEKDWSEGNNEFPDKSFYIALGKSEVHGSNNQEDFAEARQEAYDIALLRAKQEFIKNMSLNISINISDIREKGKFANPISVDANEEEIQKRLSQMTEKEKIIALLNLKIDKELKKEGFEDPTTPEAIEKAREIAASNSFEKSVNMSAEQRVAGFQTYKIFENSDGKTGDLTVIGLWSEKLSQLAGSLVTGSDVVPEGTPKKSLQKQIPSNKSDEDYMRWMFNFGTSMTTDEVGKMALISYGHAAPIFDDPDEWSDACDQAQMHAEASLILFANETVNYKAVLDQNTNIDKYKTNEIYKSEIDKKSSKDYIRTLETSSKMTLEGIAKLGDAELQHLGGSLECVVAVGWSTKSRETAEKMKEIQEKPIDLSKEEALEETDSTKDTDSSGTKITGSSDSASDDF